MTSILEKLTAKKIWKNLRLVRGSVSSRPFPAHTHTIFCASPFVWNTSIVMSSCSQCSCSGFERRKRDLFAQDKFCRGCAHTLQFHSGVKRTQSEPFTGKGGDCLPEDEGEEEEGEEEEGVNLAHHHSQDDGDDSVTDDDNDPIEDYSLIRENGLRRFKASVWLCVYAGCFLFLWLVFGMTKFAALMFCISFGGGIYLYAKEREVLPIVYDSFMSMPVMTRLKALFNGLLK